LKSPTCYNHTYPQDVNTFEKLQFYAFKGDWTPIHIRFYPIAIEGDLQTNKNIHHSQVTYEWNQT
jgi:hypothetical protein